jgi:AraC-like DNA-binding protein
LFRPATQPGSAPARRAFVVAGAEYAGGARFPQRSGPPDACPTLPSRLPSRRPALLIRPVRGSEQSITSVAALVLIGAAEQRGVAPGPLFAALGLDPSAPPDPERHIPARHYVELWDRVVTGLSDPLFAGRTGMAFQLEVLEGFGFLAMSCQNLEQAYERTKAYRSLYNVGSGWELEPVGARAMRMRWEAWVLDAAPEVGRRAVNEYQVAEMLASVRTLIGEPRLLPSRVCFRHPKQSPEQLAAIYGVLPEFGAEYDGFEVPRELLGRPLALSNASLRAYFEKQCQEASARFRADAALTGKVRRRVIDGMNGQLPTMTEVARALGMSARSLHRALESEGTKFNDVVDDVRREFSQRYLSREGLNISEVSYLVGFSDTSAFFKAFKRWTGQAPGEYRASLAP